MTEKPPQTQSRSLFKFLAGDGRRKFKRVQPPPEAPLFASLHSTEGAHICRARVMDIGLGGLCMSIGFLDKQKIKVGQHLQVELPLPGTHQVKLKGEVRHVTDFGGVFSKRMAGLQLVEGPTLDEAVFELYAYLAGILGKEPV